MGSSSGAGGPGATPGWTAPLLDRDTRRRRRSRSGDEAEAEDCGLRDLRPPQLADLPPLAQDDDPVAETDDLLQLGGDDDDAGTALGQAGDQAVDLSLRADVDSDRGLVEHERPCTRHQPLRDQRLLLVAAGEELERLPHGGSDDR